MPHAALHLTAPPAMPPMPATVPPYSLQVVRSPYLLLHATCDELGKKVSNAAKSHAPNCNNAQIPLISTTRVNNTGREINVELCCARELEWPAAIGWVVVVLPKSCCTVGADPPSAP
jgi:hypothetical protein